jgi:hypothetical protein
LVIEAVIGRFTVLMGIQSALLKPIPPKYPVMVEYTFGLSFTLNFVAPEADPLFVVGCFFINSAMFS